MFALGVPPSASGLRPWALKGPGAPPSGSNEFRSLYAVTVWRGERGPTTKKSAMEPRLAGGTFPQGLAKVMVTTGRSPATKKLPFVGLETATAALTDCAQDVAPASPAAPVGPGWPGGPSGPRSPHPSPRTTAPNSDSANLIAVPLCRVPEPLRRRGTVPQSSGGKESDFRPTNARDSRWLGGRKFCVVGQF
jgi:hypothetical protein